MRILTDFINFTWTLWDTELIDSAIWNEILDVVGWYKWCGDVVGCCWVVWRCCGFLLSCYGVIMLKILKSGDWLTDLLCDETYPPIFIRLIHCGLIVFLFQIDIVSILDYCLIQIFGCRWWWLWWWCLRWCYWRLKGIKRMGV